jgi:hypothetical protein
MIMHKMPRMSWVQRDLKNAGMDFSPNDLIQALRHWLPIISNSSPPAIVRRVLVPAAGFSAASAT